MNIGGEYECPRYGQHWETIGFQGNDPATDLRGVGLWGLIQLSYFVTKYPKIAQEGYLLSRDDIQVSIPVLLYSIDIQYSR